MTVIDAHLFDEAADSLGMALKAILYSQTQKVFRVVSRRDAWDFQFECWLDNKMRKTRCLDFTMAHSANEWEKILEQEARSIVLGMRNNEQTQ